MRVQQQMRTARVLDERVPTLLRSLIRAYLLGYASSTVPRLLTLFLTHLSNRRKGSVEGKAFLPSLRDTLLVGFHWQRFPTFCATLVGVGGFLEIPLRRLFAILFSRFSVTAQVRYGKRCSLASCYTSIQYAAQRELAEGHHVVLYYGAGTLWLSRWFSSFIAAWLSIKLLQSKESAAYTSITPSVPDASNKVVLKFTKFAGRTMDLTLFAATRALDVLVGELWDRRKARRIAAGKWTKAEAVISSLADSSIFAFSCALIMWCWIYLPERLPRAYNKWIAGAAAVDARLITALNRCRWGEFIYGQETGQAPLLQSMCTDYNWPQVWGDPTKTIPIPCEMVHMGTGKSCEYHAFRRFLKGSLMAGGMYGPLNIALQLQNPSKKGMKRAFISSIRSSAFLGSFIALFYYGVCLARTRVGPHIIGTDFKSRQMIDSGVCIGSGCILCGWSLLLENQGRRKDIALFVAPRALATLLPRRYEMKYQWRETALFATSTAIVFTCVQENPARVRGVLGKVLSSVIVK